MELSKLQKEIVESDADRIVVIASAACGKTRVLTERVRHWLKQGIDPSDICCITFTNAAADEMRVRLAEDYKDGMFIGTIHSLAARFLMRAGLKKEVNAAIDKDDFNTFFTLIKKNRSYIEHFDYILVDEAQDLSQDEYEFIFSMIKPTCYFVVGDYRQNIYENRGSSSRFMLCLANDPGTKQYSLNENYRNGSNILARAKKEIKKIGVLDDSIPMNRGGCVYEGPFNIDTLVDWIQNTGEWGEWAVLCYKNTEKDYLRKLLENYDIETMTFNLRRKTKKQLDELMKTNKVKVITIWGAKGLGFPHVAVYGCNWLTKQGKYKEGCRVDYVAYTRAMDTLMIFS